LADPKQTEVLKQINEAWEHAKAQLAQLRQSVEKTSALAQAKFESNFLTQEKDRALRDFGAAVWAQVKAGRLTLPAGLAPSIKAMQEVERRAEAKNREINSLIGEGTETVDRLKARPNKSSKTAVVTKGRKR
jgi:hypothetical protein